MTLLLVCSPPLRGIRQGDPLSPFLFAVHMETLSGPLIFEESQQNFKGIKIARTSPSISHLLYADDLVVYCRANSEDVLCIKTLLTNFPIGQAKLQVMKNPLFTLVQMFLPL